jgi:glutamine amidotransferase
MIAVIKYNSGNIASVENALTNLGVDFTITDDPEKIRRADKIIFPGVGRASTAMAELKKRNLDILLPKIKVPFLGRCLGMQLLFDYSEEDKTTCLKIIPGRVKKFTGIMKIPQMGWNRVSLEKSSQLFKNIKTNDYFYFVHSYYCEPKNKIITGITNYNCEFPSAIQKDNFYGVQFHPEKSGKTGLKLLRNFCNL